MPRWLKLLPVALVIAGCATNESREMILVDSYTSHEMKTLQSSPYEIQTWAWLRGISRADIHAIEALVARRRDIRKPILRMMAVKNDRVQVLTGSDEYRGDVYNSFHVVKRAGKWRLEESQNQDIRVTVDRAELLQRGSSGI
jgi:hypothetical protein